MVLPLLVEKEKSLRLIDEVLVKDKMVCVVAVKDQESKDPDSEDLYTWGTAAMVLKMIKLPNQGSNVLVQGLKRTRIKNFIQKEPYLKAEVEIIEEEEGSDIEVEAMIHNIKTLFQKLLELAPQIPRELGIMVMNIDQPGNLADLVGSSLNVNIEDKQKLLETSSAKLRLKAVLDMLNREIEILELGKKIQSDVKSEMDDRQREYFLREQLKAIQRELGEGDDSAAEIEGLREKVKEANMPEEAEQAAEKELGRLSHMSPSSAEYTVSHTYLDWLIELPWSVSTEDNLDLKIAQKVLDEDHYDLTKIKERVLEYLAVRKLRNDSKGAILCFGGPPGTGKTSLGRSIARAMNRKFFRMSLGGMRDEAEIRGHRRTYVGALPGRIIQALRSVGSNNPVFMLDEVDKLGMDFRGDPSAALLEVLDTEQNFSFTDHFLSVGFDLSKVMFILTANVLDTIPPALLDRLEVLYLSGYIQSEKVEIAKKYLIPKQLEENGLKPEHIEFKDDSLTSMVQSYTREAGLRNLEREIAKVCRHLAKKVAEGDENTMIITKDNISDFLGQKKFFSEVADRASLPGVATGMAWTPTGGDILFIEASRMKGNKSLTLTGQLGDVMKESAQAALSYIRSNAEKLNIDVDFFQTSDLHIHVPAGAIPKDGPSAGVTMFTALSSLLTGKPIRSEVAMTGEITLRGVVLPVGGIKEKVLAARQAGIKTIILPHKNKTDLEEIDPPLREGMEFHFIKNVSEIVPLAFAGPSSNN
jgi:ATP-dependent Lon protease